MSWGLDRNGNCSFWLKYFKLILYLLWISFLFSVAIRKGEGMWEDSDPWLISHLLHRVVGVVKFLREVSPQPYWKILYSSHWLHFHPLSIPLQHTSVCHAFLVLAHWSRSFNWAIPPRNPYLFLFFIKFVEFPCKSKVWSNFILLLIWWGFNTVRVYLQNKL